MTQMVWERGLYRGQKGNLISTARPNKNGFRKNVRYMKFLGFIRNILVVGIVIVVIITVLGI